MENTVLKQFSFNFKDILIDEIALEGLDGIVLDLLWRRVEKRISSPISTKMMARLWNFILNNDAISVYELPEPRPRLEIIDRFNFVNPVNGHLFDHTEYFDGPYEYCPVKDNYGSCVYYDTRKELNKTELKDLNYEQIFDKYKDTLVLVASMEERWKALIPHKPFENIIHELTPLQYCMIELVGRARENGQTTIGHSNLPKILKDPKLVFYNRKRLQMLDLLKVQPIILTVAGKTGRALLVRLKRFHKPAILTVPKTGIIHTIIKHILEQPDQTDSTESMLNKGILPPKDYKRILKNNHFKCEQRAVYLEDKKKTVTKRFMTVNFSDESSQSDDEGGEGETSLTSQYKVKVNLARQAYERILDSKDRGLSLIELGKMLNVEFYTARMILRFFQRRKLVKEFYEDVGRIRVGRFVAISNIYDTGTNYAKEHKKFLENFAKSEVIESTSAEAQNAESDSEVPRKKIKLEDSPNVSVQEIKLEALEGITQITTLTNNKCPAITDIQKKPTLRQLKFANGIMKILKEKKVVAGILLLNVLVSREINETQMDSKNLKAFIQSLATAGKLKMLKVDWPGYEDKCTYLFTDPHVQITDPIVRAKYKEIFVRAIKNMKMPEVEEPINTNVKTKPLTLYAYQRYTKLRKLHAFLMNLMYFEGSKNFHSSLPPGFTCFVEIFPEFTVEFAVGSLTEPGLAKLPKSKTKTIHSLFKLKLADVPSEIFRIFVTSCSLEGGFINNIRLLSLLGLLQLIEEPKALDEFKTPIGHVFYVNRRASIVDTTGDWPRAGANIEALKKSYYFETMEDVEKYWEDVQNISTSTNIGINPSERTRKTIPKYFKPRQDVHKNDNGQILGDGRGPCGFDSLFFMDIPRLWSDSIVNQNKKKTKKIIKKKPIPKPMTPAQIKRAQQTKTLATILKPTVERELPENKRPIRTHVKTRVRTRIWPKDVDRIVMLCKAALTVMSPVAQPGCIALRDMIIKYLLIAMGSKNLLKYVRKRIEQQENDLAIVYQRDCVINELKRRDHLMRKYEGVFDRIKAKNHGNLKHALNAARVVMLELVYTMWQLMQSKSFNQQVPCIASNLQNFHDNYTICESNVNTEFNSYKTPPGQDPTLATIKEGIIQTLAIYLKSHVPADKSPVILQIFKPFEELLMRQAMEELHRSGAIAAKEKRTAGKPYKFIDSYNTLTMSYRLSEKLRRAWLCRLNSTDFIDKLEFIMHEDLPQTGLSGNPEVNCFLSELCATGVVEMFNETVPVLTCPSHSLLEEERMNVTDMQMNFKLKTGSIGWRAKGNIENIAQQFEDVDWKEPLDNLIRNAVIEESTAQADENDIIISHLKQKKELGSDFRELQRITGFDIETLQKKLSDLESSKIITHLGYFENVVVLTEYTAPWALTIQDKKVVPTPWMSHEIEIKPYLLIKWAGTIINRVFKKPGCSIKYLSDSCQFISIRAVLQICEVLAKYKCLSLKYVDIPECDLFSDDNSILEVKEHNPYGFEDNILAFPTADMIIRFAYFRQFISTYDLIDVN